ncbi:hypothetical protein AUJ46_01265 [Candidatus Peregrinibacteria bacterium CG1_02_54_53]|nr:MAG: hypothetical protein AUJ46_01265 [Candidatus Peregrinibacteria bacterium CG1_02_54_53]
MKLRSPLVSGSLALTVLALLAYGWIAVFGWHRPYVNWMPWDLAEYLVKNQRPASECWDLVWFEIMAPSAAEQRALCIYTYAKLTFDPSACELLMPSEYGLSCINDVTAQEYKDHMDSGFFEWDECSKPQSDPLRADWCNLLRAHRNRNAADCLPIRNDVIRAGCTLKFEAWQKYPDLRNSFYFGKAAPQ